MDDDEPEAPIVPVASVVPAPVVPVAASPSVAPETPVAPPAVAQIVAEEPAPAPSPDPDEYIEPPIVPRPYAVAKTAYAPGPPAYTPPAQPLPSSEPFSSASPSYPPLGQPAGSPFPSYASPVPPPARAQGEVATPHAAPSADDEPPVTFRPYAQPGYGAHVPVPPVQGPQPAFGSVDPYAVGGPDIPVPATTGFGSAKPRTENVGRGLLLALIAVVGGCVLAAVVYHLGYVASIVALAMGGAGIFLYAKGAGSPPRKGAVALVVLLMAGILLAWISSVGTELFFYYVDQTGSSNGALAFAVQGAFSLDLFKATLKDFLIFVGFGALGIFGVARQLLLPRKIKK
jgi:hypothetical protein